MACCTASAIATWPGRSSPPMPATAASSSSATEGSSPDSGPPADTVGTVPRASPCGDHAEPGPGGAACHHGPFGTLGDERVARNQAPRTVQINYLAVTSAELL